MTNLTERENQFAKSPTEFPYMIMGRLIMDCGYFLGNGNGHEKHLWGLTVEGHIQAMRDAWDVMVEKPEWISFADIQSYETKLLAKREEIRHQD